MKNLALGAFLVTGLLVVLSEGLRFPPNYRYPYRVWYNPLIRWKGKREADSNPCPDMDQEKAQKTLARLALVCPQFAIDPSVGLNKEAVDAAFKAVDADNDNKLNEKELDLFEEALEAYEVCASEETKANTQVPANDEVRRLARALPAADEEFQDDEEPLMENDEEPPIEDDEEPPIEDDEEPPIEDDEEPPIEDDEEPIIEK